MKMDDLGVPVFAESTICIRTVAIRYIMHWFGIVFFAHSNAVWNGGPIAPISQVSKRS